jgi:hypothetical protein
MTSDHSEGGSDPAHEQHPGRDDTCGRTWVGESLGRPYLQDVGFHRGKITAAHADAIESVPDYVISSLDDRLGSVLRQAQGVGGENWLFEDKTKCEVGRGIGHDWVFADVRLRITGHCVFT